MTLTGKGEPGLAPALRDGAPGREYGSPGFLSGGPVPINDGPAPEHGNLVRGYPEIAAGGWRLRAEVPDGIFSLAVGAGDDAVEYAEAAGPWLPPGALDRVGEGALAQLGAVRKLAARAGLGYLGVMTGQGGQDGPANGRPWMVMLGIAATGFRPPPGVEPRGLLATLLRHQYPGPSALVEEFETARGQAVGVRRCDQLTLPGPPAERRARAIDTGISQAFVIFPEAGLIGAVTGYCFDVSDIDLATLFTAKIAHGLVPVPAPGH